MSYEDILLQECVKRIVPGEIQRNQMRHELVVVGHLRPRLRRDLDRWCLAKEMHVHDLPTERWRLPLKVRSSSKLLESCPRLVPGRRLHLGQSFVDEKTDLLRCRIVPNKLQQLLRTVLLRGANQFEQVIEHVAMILQFLCRPLGGHPTTLVQRLVEDAFSMQGATVVTWRNSRALTPWPVSLSPFLGKKKDWRYMDIKNTMEERRTCLTFRPLTGQARRGNPLLPSRSEISAWTPRRSAGNWQRRSWCDWTVLQGITHDAVSLNRLDIDRRKNGQKGSKIIIHTKDGSVYLVICWDSGSWPCGGN
jgi:hypothetical protein